MKYLLIGFFSGLLISCSRENLKYEKPYFDFDSLVHVQILQLSDAKVAVAKKSILKNKQDSIHFIPDTTQWKYELDLFSQLDVINKPSFKNSYQLTEGKDEHSNLQVRTYSTNEKSPVPWVKLYYQADLRKLKKIESTYVESNLMFSSARKMKLEFDGEGKEMILTGYHIRGYQRMILSDSVLFSLDCKIR